MSWEQLLSIRKEAAQMAAEDAARRPTACQRDGEPLREGPGGLYCPFDGWRPGDDAEE